MVSGHGAGYAVNFFEYAVDFFEYIQIVVICRMICIRGNKGGKILPADNTCLYTYIYNMAYQPGLVSSTHPSSQPRESPPKAVVLGIIITSTFTPSKINQYDIITYYRQHMYLKGYFF